jgi:hypothetical protein
MDVCGMSTRVLHAAFIVSDSLKQRFFAKTIEASSGCMIWTGAVQRHSYGAFKIGHEKIDAHVASWRIANGGHPVPIGQLVMHKCDCRMCVNPDHLKLGTVSQNMLDAHKDGRGDDFKSQGEHHYNAKLNDELVRTLRSEYAVGGISVRRLAEKHGIGYACVRSAIEGRNWKHVTASEASR